MVIPVHDRDDLLPAAIASVRAQDTGAEVEIVVVDDASSDRSAEVAAALGARVVALEVNGGPSAARNAGIAAASGRWVAFLDSDDRWAPWHLRTLLAAAGGQLFVASSGVTRAGGRVRLTGSPTPRQVRVRRPGQLLRPENAVNTSGMMVRTEVLRRCGGFAGGRFSEDLELWLRVAAVGGGVLLPDVTLYNHAHEGQTSRRNPDAMGSSAHGVIGGAVAAGTLTTAEQRRFATVSWWDDLRAGGAPGGAALLQAVRRPRRLPDLGLLLLARAAQRHRWRLRRRQTAGVLALSEP